MSVEFDLVVNDGYLVLDDGLLRGSIGVRDGRISAVAESGVLRGREVIDARDLLVFPGLVDLHVHFRDPGLTHKEDFESGSRAAARGGVTTIADMPNTLPPTSTVDRLVAKRRTGEASSHVDFMLWASSKDPSEIARLAQAGVVGIKVYMAGPDLPAEHEGTWTGGNSPLSPDLHVGRDDDLLRIFGACAENDLPLAIHLGNSELRTRGRWSGRPFRDIVEELRTESTLEVREAAQRCVLFARETGARIHIAHVPAAALAILVRARSEGVPVTIETLAPTLSFDDIPGLGVLGFDRYRSSAEIDLHFEALADGRIDTIGTDHAPHTYEEKMQGDIDILKCPSGYASLDMSFSVLLDQILRGRSITMPRLATVTAGNPAKIAGISDRKGRLTPGRDADFVLVDPSTEWTVTKEDLESKPGWSPFVGRRLRGRPVMTLLRGIQIASSTGVSDDMTGRFVAPSKSDEMA
jgi:dihydroorotase-like cyclic amidohydrolase